METVRVQHSEKQNVFSTMSKGFKRLLKSIRASVAAKSNMVKVKCKSSKFFRKLVHKNRNKVYPSSKSFDTEDIGKGQVTSSEHIDCSVVGDKESIELRISERLITKHNDIIATEYSSKYVKENNIYHRNHFETKFINIPLLPAIDGNPRLCNKKCLIIDLDETLIHSNFQKTVNDYDFFIKMPNTSESTNGMDRIYVSKRPNVDMFLETLSQYYEIVIFTASISKYANAIIDVLDPMKNRVTHRLFRDSCIYFKGMYIKDLSMLGRPMDRIIIIDNSPTSYMLHPEHAIAIPSWYSDKNDKILLRMLDPLIQLSSTEKPLEFLDMVNLQIKIDYILSIG